MKKPNIRIHDTSIDEVIDREMTDEEYAEFVNPSYLKDPQYLKQQKAAEAKETARQAIADRLGLTADELQVLLG